jgi:prephenate dehydrogenase
VNGAAAERPLFDTVAIVGFGLIGGSIALAAKERWPSTRVIAIDRPEVAERAALISPADHVCSELRAVGGADLVVLAAPVRQNILLLSDIAGEVREGALVTDAGSTKREIVASASLDRRRFTFVGGHPLGGGALRGIDHARADLFRGRAWVLTPDPATPREAIVKLETFVAALGAIPVVKSADEHDRVMAFVSHLPQIAASALMTVVGDAAGVDGFALAGRGLVDTTRLASSAPEIWRDITATNADQIAPALDGLIELLQQLRADLGDGRRLEQVFTSAALWRDRLVSGRNDIISA